MRSIYFMGCILGLCGSVLAQKPDLAKPLKPSYEIEVGGMKRQLVTAQDELAVKKADGRRQIQAVPGGDLVTQAKAVRAKKVAGDEVEIVLVEASGGPKSRKTKEPRRHFVTREILVRLKPGITSKALAKMSGLRIAREPEYAPGMIILDAGTSEAALAAMESLRGMPEVEAADVMLATQREKKLIPNDPLFTEQWHLLNTTQLGGALWVDTGITPVWDTFRGTGVTIGIIDDGVQHAHPDIQGHYNTTIDYDYNSNDADPTPVNLAEDGHGTSCAGVAAAIGGDGLGVSGAAPEATLTGFRLIAAPSTDQNEADAFSAHNQLIHIKSNSWGFPDGSGYGRPGSLATAALEAAATTGRGGKGVIQVFAGGNGFDVFDNSNYDGYANSPYVIAVAAVNDQGFQSYYSEPGANILISAPSNSGGKNQGIRTTDLTGTGGYNTAAGAAGNYANDFGGTSSACPLVSGIIALMLEANPNLGWRDVKEILIRTARKPQRTDSDWKTNSAGLSFNHKYGAGLIDAAGAVALAQQWANLPAMTTTQLSATSLPVALTDNSASGQSRSVNFTTANFRVEHVTVTVNATHTAIGDLEVTLTSPSGMVSKLAQAHSDGTDNLAWTFSSVFHWGEAAAGTWTVKVADRIKDDTGSLTGITVKLWGSNQAAGITGTTATLTSETNTPTNSAADPGEMVTFNLTLKNNGTAATTALTATLLPLGGVRTPSAAQNYGVINAGATASRSFTFKLDGGCGMSIPLVLKLQDGANDRGFANLSIPLGTVSNAAFNGGAITIRDNNIGSPSPSILDVSGLEGRVQNLTAQLNGFRHAFVDDVGALLHSPEALKIRLFCGGVESAVTSSINLTFDDEAPTAFPSAGNLTTGSYRPDDLYGPSRNFFGDSAVEAALTLGEYRGVPANGDWRLYMQDFAAGDAGSLTSWRLNFTTVTCTDNVFFTSAAITGGEEAGSILASVTRTGGTELETMVNYETTGGTANPDNDYTSTSGTLTFEPGERVKTFEIPIHDDFTIEPNETISLRLSLAGGNATLGTRSTMSVIIDDNDVFTPLSISPATQNVDEGVGYVAFTVSRAALGDAGTVFYSTTSGTASDMTDFEARSGTLEFTTSDLEQTFEVPTMNDDIPEAEETFTVSLSNATGALTLGSPITATVTLFDGDSDSDSMQDDYEFSVGLDPGIDDAALDLDGDGYTNIDEYVIGTLPNNSSSFFRAVPNIGPVNVSVTFPTLVGRLYRVERSDSLALDSWTVVQENIVGTGSQATILDSGAASLPKGFYRVVVTRLAN